MDRSSAPPKPRGFGNHLIHKRPDPPPAPVPEEPVVATDDNDSDTLESASEDELGYHGDDSSVSLVCCHALLNGGSFIDLTLIIGHHLLCIRPDFRRPELPLGSTFPPCGHTALVRRQICPMCDRHARLLIHTMAPCRSWGFARLFCFCLPQP